MARRSGAAQDRGERLPAAVLRRRNLLEALREAPARGLSKGELTGRLDRVSGRTLDRDLKDLRRAGAEIEAKYLGTPRQLHFRLVRAPGWDETLGIDVHLALRIAGLLLSRAGSAHWEEPLALLERMIHDRVSAKERKLLDALKAAVRVEGGVEDPVESPDALPAILQALAEGQQLEVDYRAAGAEKERTFRLAPHSLTHDLFGGGAFLLAWALDRRVVMQLRLARIAAARVLPRPAAIPDPALLARAARYQVGGWVSDREPFEVRARIRGHNWVQAFQDAAPALPDFESVAVDGGAAAEVRFKANHPNGARRWIQQFGADAELLTVLPD